MPGYDMNGEIFKWLFETGCIQFGEFNLRDRRKSPIYINLRRLRSLIPLREAIVRQLRHKTRLLDFKHVADIPHSISPIVAILAHVAGLSQLTPRPPKEYGTKASVEGIFEPGEIVLVIDDVITSAGSKFEAITTLEQVGLVVTDVAVIVDREQGGREELESRGYKLTTLFKLSDILDYYLAEGMISREEYDKTRKELWNK